MKRLAAILGALLCLAAASDPSERLKDPAQEARARHLFREVRCLVCQNESIDDSEAEFAQDLRRIVRQQVAAGRTDDEVEAFLLARYGEFILLRPSFDAANLLLWFGPLAVVIAGGAFLALRVRRRPADEALTGEEEARLASFEAAPSGHDLVKGEVQSTDREGSANSDVSNDAPRP